METVMGSNIGSTPYRNPELVGVLNAWLIHLQYEEVSPIPKQSCQKADFQHKDIINNIKPC
jgi:hypothetical protein